MDSSRARTETSQPSPPTVTPGGIHMAIQGVALQRAGTGTKGRGLMTSYPSPLLATAEVLSHATVFVDIRGCTDRGAAVRNKPSGVVGCWVLD